MISEALKAYVRSQERKLVEMKERLRLLTKVIPEIEATLKDDKKRWGIK